MKTFLRSVISFAVAAVLLGIAGCATSGGKNDATLLSQAGFKGVPATTPEQQAQLKKLPANKVSAVKRNGQIFFVFPDHAEKKLYIGKEAQFHAYQRLLKVEDEARIARAKKIAAEARDQSQLLGDWNVPAWDQQNF